ncbi:MAG: hypothetical protein AAFU61_18065, partial [Pseudomonadota bacterium]
PGKLGWTYHVNGSAWGGGLAVPLFSAFVPEGYVDAIVASIFAPQSAPAGYIDHVGPALTLRRGSMRANARQVNGLRPHVVEMSARYGEISVPVEIVHGDADTIVPLSVHSAKVPDQIPGARLTVLEALGGPRERRRDGTAAAPPPGPFAAPLVVALALDAATPGPALPRASGLPDDVFD